MSDKPVPVRDLKKDIPEAADRVAQILRRSGYFVTFTPQSLWEIDRVFDEQTREGVPVPGGLMACEIGSRLFGLGAYLGEVIRRSKRGVWQIRNVPEGDINVPLKLPGGRLIWPMRRIVLRLHEGPEQGIAAFGAGIGLLVGPKPDIRRKQS